MEIIKIKKMGGIKCDNPNCNYKDDTVQASEYPSYLNKPCPICGSNLLTEADFKSFIKIMKVINKINSFGNKLPKFIQKWLEKSEEGDMSIDFNGSGKVDIKVHEKYDLREQ
ncbi:hypothetical protein [Lacrimispora amygdalina]|uniref:hypothetical protein n=1 Tax=Lacrimispora amygdalina TaxID=253257 RepID=UPI000BE2FB99|nr:hypothetical protein [Lacrimispora amygdalina]